MVRLRKMGLEELDVSSERLKLRSHIEQEIDKILVENSFSRVMMIDDDKDNNKKDGDNDNNNNNNETTKWNRPLWLYQRKGF